MEINQICVIEKLCDVGMWVIYILVGVHPNKYFFVLGPPFMNLLNKI